MKGITKAELEEALNMIFNQKIIDNTPPDIEVEEDGNYFAVKILSGKRNIYTGKGGLKQFLQAFSLPFLKIKYNGKILSMPETEQFINRYKNISL